MRNELPKIRDDPTVEISIPLRTRSQSINDWPLHLKSRRRLLREFHRWYLNNENDFAIKLRFLKRTDRNIDFSFVGVTSEITGSVFPDEIAIRVDWLNEPWDYIFWIETYPTLVPGGFACRQCDPEVRPIVTSREMLWRIELFQELRDWVNNTLATADRLEIVGYSSGDRWGATWATLIEDA